MPGSCSERIHCGGLLKDKYFLLGAAGGSTKELFYNGLAEEAPASQLQAGMRRLLEQEDPAKPWSDQALADALAAQGVAVGGRTVANTGNRWGSGGGVSQRAQTPGIKLEHRSAMALSAMADGARTTDPGTPVRQAGENVSDQKAAVPATMSASRPCPAAEVFLKDQPGKEDGHQDAEFINGVPPRWPDRAGARSSNTAREAPVLKARRIKKIQLLRPICAELRLPVMKTTTQAMQSTQWCGWRCLLRIRYVFPCTALPRIELRLANTALA